MFVSHVPRQKRVQWSKALQQKLFQSIGEKKADVVQDKHSHGHDADRWTWGSANRSKPSSVDSLSSSDWFSRELLGRQSLDSSSKVSESDWLSVSWTWGVKDRRFDTAFALRKRFSNTSVFRSYTPWRGSPWLLARGSYSHRRNTKTKVLIQNESFLLAGADDVMVITRNSRLRHKMC